MSGEISDREIRNRVLAFQQNELTEHLFYKSLSKRAKGKNSELLRKISEDELRHYSEWKTCSRVDVPPKISEGGGDNARRKGA
ncbi:MAG: hypothetical protein QXF52_10015 [Thermoproteota archaeon]